MRAPRRIDPPSPDSQGAARQGLCAEALPRHERITATLWVCRACHNQIHRLFSEKELALTYNSREALLSDERLRTFVDWLASKPPGFMPRH